MPRSLTIFEAKAFDISNNGIAQAKRDVTNLGADW
jgi:hypothetical protein